MTDAPTLTGQDIAEAQGAVRGLLDRALAGTGATSNDYVVLRVVTGRGPWASARVLSDYLAGQPQLGLDPQTAAELVSSLQTRGLITTGSGPVGLTAEGTGLHAHLAEVSAVTTSKLYAGLDVNDLATAHAVLRQLIERAGQLSKDS
jgi:hypothetical protein